MDTFGLIVFFGGISGFVFILWLSDGGLNVLQDVGKATIKSVKPVFDGVKRYRSAAAKWGVTRLTPEVRKCLDCLRYPVYEIKSIMPTVREDQAVIEYTVIVPNEINLPMVARKCAMAYHPRSEFVSFGGGCLGDISWYKDVSHTDKLHYSSGGFPVRSDVRRILSQVRTWEEFETRKREWALEEEKVRETCRKYLREQAKAEAEAKRLEERA